jgi:hypothetical protein
MANCKFCGQWAGWMSDAHSSCMREAEGRGMRREASPEPRGPMTPRDVFWAVFGALCLFSLVAGFVAAFINAASR